jgi:hypothetical protein
VESDAHDADAERTPSTDPLRLPRLGVLVLRFYALRGEAYEELERSAALPSCDPAVLVRAMTEPTHSGAVKVLRAAMRRA